MNTVRELVIVLATLAMGFAGLQGCSKKGAGPEAGDGKNSGKPAGAMTPVEAKARLQSVNNLRRLAQAMLTHTDAYRALPPAGGEPGPYKLPGLSWRAHLLPYLENEATYMKLKEEAWAGKAPMGWNRPDLAKLTITQFASPVPGKGKDTWETYYRVFIGNGAAFETGSLTKYPNDFTDGVVNTILIVEAGEPVPWPKPDELQYDPKKPLPKLGGLFADGFYAAFADGTVRFIPRSIDDKLLRAFITRSGDEQIKQAQLPLVVDTKELERIVETGKQP
jgi:hypothetical protein